MYNSKLPCSLSHRTGFGCSRLFIQRGGDSPDTITLRLGMVDSESSNYYKGAMTIAEEVKNATDGAITITVMASGSIGDERAMVEMAMNNDLDIATAANSVMTNWIPEMAILDQAFLWDTVDQAHAAVDGDIGDLIEDETEALGLHTIGYMESGFRNVFSTKPVTSIDDFKGLKIRTMQNAYHIAAFESFGALPVAMPASEQFTALQQGTIDAVENAVTNAWVNGFYDVTRDITYTNHAYVYILLLMSDDAWNRIPDDLRDPFLAGVQKGYEAQRQYLLDANDEAKSKLEAEGVTFHEIDREQLKSAYLATTQAQEAFDPQWQAAVDAAKQSAPEE